MGKGATRKPPTAFMRGAQAGDGLRGSGAAPTRANAGARVTAHHDDHGRDLHPRLHLLQNVATGAARRESRNLFEPGGRVADAVQEAGGSTMS